MASHSSKSRYAIKECSTCGSLYTKECCSIGSFEDKILTPVPSTSSVLIANVELPMMSCRGCAFLRKKFDEDLLAYCVENGIFKDFQDTSESSDDNTNVVNALREPCVVNQDPGVKSSQDPPQIDHNCAHYGYNCPPKVPIISNPEQCNQTINELPQILPNENSFIYNSKPHSFNVSPSVLTYPPQLQFETYLCELCGNNAHYGYDCSPQFPFVYEQEPSTLFLEEYRREFLLILLQIPPELLKAEFDSNNEHFDDYDNLRTSNVILREKLLNVHRLISKIESLKDNPTPDHVLESPYPFPIPIMDSDLSDTSLSHLDNSLPEFETFSDHTEETRSGSTTTHANYSLPEYDSFLFEIEPDQEGLISIDNSNDPLLELPEFESFHFDPSLPRPPPEPPDVCLDMLYNDESFEPGEGENIVVSNVEEDDSFTFTIRTFLPFLTYPEVSPLSCSTGSEDLIFDPGIITFYFLKPLAVSIKYGYIKNQETSKRASWTREPEEYKAEARKAKPQSKSAKKNQSTYISKITRKQSKTGKAWTTEPEEYKAEAKSAKPQYGYIKNHKKTVKNEQARTREPEEYKAEARKAKPQSKSAKVSSLPDLTSERMVEDVYLGTDKSKMTRKQSKTSKHGHENQKSTKPKPEKPSLSQNQPKSVKDGQQKSTSPTIFHFNPLSFTKVQE
ncbi:hypothetical protein Tco_1562810 [Tanacetum coccineum]